MKNLKSILVAGALVVAGSAMADGYNRVAISYDATHFGYNKEWYGNDKDADPSFNTNGFGLNYIHGFGLSAAHPMFLEVGASLGFNFYSDSEEYTNGTDKFKYKSQFQNINLTIPVNFAWKFDLPKNFSITPYTGINFKLNFLTQAREGEEYNGKTEWSDWTNYLKKDEEKGISKDEVWNVFQMGWQIGAVVGWKQFSLGLQYGIDFIPAYSYTYKDDGYKATYKVNTSSFKLSLGYQF